jgi:dephospho-CoA kinase
MLGFRVQDSGVRRQTFLTDDRRPTTDNSLTVLGLTGSIGMGKTTVAAQFARLGAEVSDADKVAHALMQPHSTAFDEIAHAFPAAVKKGEIDRRELGKIVFADPAALAKLEIILHPRVRAAHEHKIRLLRRQRRPLLVLEIPLLFESGAHTICDYVAVVTAPPYIQRQRVLKRPGMTEQKFRQILARQLPDAEKRARADFVINTGLGEWHALREVRDVMKKMIG